MSTCHFVPSPSRRRSPTQTLVLGVVLLLGLASLACGDKATSEVVADRSTARDSELPSVPPAKAASDLDTKYFTTVVPEGWEILADDLEAMGLMTLAEKGTGGAHGVYMKFEPGYSGDPMANVSKLAANYDGSAAASSTRNGVEWASTRYTYSGITQTMNIASHAGHKVTFTVMGADYSTDPGVRAIFDSLILK